MPKTKYSRSWYLIDARDRLRDGPPRVADEKAVRDRRLHNNRIEKRFDVDWRRSAPGPRAD
jgi:hypothetical protein